MKKIMFIIMLVALVTMCHADYQTYGQQLIMFNEPVTVRVIETYFYGHRPNSSKASDISAFCLATNVVGNGWNGSFIRNDYQLELTPNIEDGKYVTTFYEIDECPSNEITVYTKYNGVWLVPCRRQIIFFDGYYVDEYTGDKYELWYYNMSETSSTDARGAISDLEFVKEKTKEYNSYRAYLAQPDMQLHSVITMRENEPKISFDITYSGEKIVWGKKELTDNEWVDVTDMDKSEYRFFKVTLKSN